MTVIELGYSTSAGTLQFYPVSGRVERHRRHGRTRCPRCAMRYAEKWETEARVLATMLAKIVNHYDLARHTGGDNELLRSAVIGAQYYLFYISDTEPETAS